MTKPEKQIIEKRLDGKCFSEFDEKELRHAIDQVMLRGAAISGCALPITEFFAEFIAAELAVFMIEMGYGDLTLEEILFAMRLNAIGWTKYPSGEVPSQVEFTGHSFNITFIAKVLSIYMSFRNTLDRKLQNQIDGYE